MTDQEKIPEEDSSVNTPQPEETGDVSRQLPTTADDETDVSQPQTPNTKPLTSSMEVHHPHHIHHSKKWKGYLFEFLLLFLAITLGFYVENEREHFIERQREKQFIRSLVNDLIADTTKLNNIINARLDRERRLDSLSTLLNSDAPETYTDDLYFYAVTASRTNLVRFLPNDGTMQQLKNSGAFRLIRTRLAADSIAKYDVSIRNLHRQGELEETLIQDYRGASANIFDALKFETMMDSNNNVTRLPGIKPSLLPFTKSELSTWNYKMFSMKALNKAIRRDSRLLLRQAINLLNTLQKEYKLR